MDNKKKQQKQHPGLYQHFIICMNKLYSTFIVKSWSSLHFDFYMLRCEWTVIFLASSLSLIMFSCHHHNWQPSSHKTSNSLKIIVCRNVLCIYSRHVMRIIEHDRKWMDEGIWIPQKMEGEKKICIGSSLDMASYFSVKEFCERYCSRISSITSHS